MWIVAGLGIDFLGIRSGGGRIDWVVGSDWGILSLGGLVCQDDKSGATAC